MKAALVEVALAHSLSEMLRVTTNLVDLWVDQDRALTGMSAEHNIWWTGTLVLSHC